MNVLMLLVILVVFGILLNFANKITVIRGKRTYWIIGTYISVLLIAVVLYFSILNKDDARRGDINAHEIPNLEQVIYENKSIEEFEPYLTKQRQLHYNNDELHINSAEVDYTNIPILIERKSADDFIDVNTYQTPNVVEGIDVTDYEALSVTLIDEVMLISMDDYRELHLDVYKNDFPIRQFTGEKIFEDDHFSFSRPTQLIYLSIPEHIELTIDENIDVHYTNE